MQLAGNAIVAVLCNRDGLAQPHVVFLCRHDLNARRPILINQPLDGIGVLSCDPGLRIPVQGKPVRNADLIKITVS